MLSLVPLSFNWSNAEFASLIRDHAPLGAYSTASVASRAPGSWPSKQGRVTEEKICLGHTRQFRNFRHGNHEDGLEMDMDIWILDSKIPPFPIHSKFIQTLYHQRFILPIAAVSDD